MVAAKDNDNSRNRILDVTWDLAARSGVGATSMAAVARAAGVSRQAVYLYFPNRATLLSQVLRRHDERSGFSSRVSQTASLPPVEALAALIGEWFAYMPQVAPVARGLHAALEAGDDGGQAFTERMGNLREAFRAACARVAADGRLHPSWTVDEAADWVWAHVHFTSWHHLVEERSWAPEHVLERTLASLARELIV